MHTFSHAELARLTPDEVERELSLTQLALAGATGETSYLMRPPYSSTNTAVRSVQFDVFKHVGTLGYVVALSDVDSLDWRRDGIEAIVRAATPQAGEGGVVLLHDAGGDRSQTVAALDSLIPLLKAKGYRFATLTDATGLPPAGTPALFRDAALGGLMVVTVGVATTTVAVLKWLLLLAGALVILRLVLTTALAIWSARRRSPRRWSWGGTVTEPVSVVVPAYNEKECIAATVRSLVASDHPVEVIVVDDGSTDGTADIVRALRLPNVRVITQPNGGKAMALNTGASSARHDIIVMMDGDTVFEPSTVRLLVQPFADAAVGAVAGNAKVANRSGLLARWQHIEYVVVFNLERRAHDLLGCISTVSGAIGAFRRRALLDAGRLKSDTLAEDTDLTMAIACVGWRVVYEARARAWTEAPTTLADLWRQRLRWNYGMLQTIWKHRATVIRRGPAGRFGRLALVNLAVFQVLSQLLAPLIDLFLVYGLLFLDTGTTVLVWLAVNAVQFLAAVIGFRLEREPIRDLIWLPAQQVLYRQMMYVVVLQSIGKALAGVRLPWQKLQRIGESANDVRVTEALQRSATSVASASPPEQRWPARRA